MSEFLEGKIALRLGKTFFAAVFLYLPAAPSYSAPQNQSVICESQYKRCIKRITEAYTRNKILCESAFRRCSSGKQR